MTTRPTGGRPPDGRRPGIQLSTAPPPLPARGSSSGQRARTSGQAELKKAYAIKFPNWPKIDLSSQHVRVWLRRTGRFGRMTLYTFMPIVLLALMAIGILYVRLRHGPVAFDFLVSPIERGINAKLVNNVVKVQGAEIRLGSSGGIEFRLRDVSVMENDGETVATAPLAAVTISTAALWRARVVPARVELIDPQISLAYTDSAGLVLNSPKLRASVSDGESGVSAPVQQSVSVATKSEPHQLNIAKMLSDSSRRARLRLDATSYLTEFALRNATVNLEYSGEKSSWIVPEASIDFDHTKKRSVISGRAKVDSVRGPWTFSFLTDESEKTGRLQVKTTVRDLVPATLAAAAPPFALLRALQVPIAGHATVELSTQGDIESSEVALEVGNGRILIPDLQEPLAITGGLFRLVFDGKARHWKLEPSPIKWADGSILFTGEMTDTAAANGDGPPVWRFALNGQNGVFEAAEFAVKPINLDVWTMQGQVTPRRGLVEISDFRIAGGGGEARLSGIMKAGADGQSSQLNLALSSMPLETLKAIWPRAIASGSRNWVGENVSAANFKGGKVSFVSGDYLNSTSPPPNGGREQLDVTMEVSDAVFVPFAGMLPITAPRGLIQVANSALEVTIPEAFVSVQGDRKVPFKAMRLTSPDVIIEPSQGEISFSTQSALGPFLEAVEQMPVRAVREAAPFPKAGDGKVDGQFKINMPLSASLREDDINIEGKARVTDGRFGKVGGHFDVQGFSLNLDLTPTTLDAKGDLLVNGVPAKISGQRVFGTASDQQPPIKISAKLDEADRKQLGLDINDMVRGVVPVEISLQRGLKPEFVTQLSADLTGAELVLDKLAWRKAGGRPAKLEADIVGGKKHKTELQNFKVTGDDIAINGWIGLGDDSKLKEFHFPTFALNVVSRLDVQGSVGKDNIWNINANGQTYDGRDFFRSLFQVGEGGSAKSKSEKSSGGANVSLDIRNVIGASDVTLRGLKLKLSSRSGDLTALDARGTLDGGAAVAVALDSNGASRRLLIDSVDAGQALRLLDFYPNMQGGRLKLEVNLDGRGAAEKTGVLWVDQFKILGDPIVSEVVSSADQGRPAISGKRPVTREVFEFDKMRAPFSIGYGQFVLEESYMKGPLLGANVRGKVDFKTRRVNIGGTYIPLQGLNGAFGGIPVLGQLISGTQGEGIFGITFAVQGAISDPQVIVNPLSMVAPGIFRDMFQMTTIDPKVQVREEKAPKKPATERVRASSTPGGEAKRDNPQKLRTAKPEVVDGWSSSTTPAN